MVPSDSAVLQRLGEMYDQEGDKSQAFHYYFDVSFNFKQSLINFHLKDFILSMFYCFFAVIQVQPI